MSGRQFFNHINRRSFLLRAGLLSSWIVLNGCLRKLKPGASNYSHIQGSLKGPDAKAGHLLRDKVPLPAPAFTKKVKTLIVGSGISGLSAARWLKKQGHHDFELLELEQQPGGNSRYGKNEVSAYPLGAHYVTVANNHDTELVDFFKETGVITHEENGLPFYNEYFLCFDPEERLLINGQWQEGIIPEFGIGENDRQQLKAFLQFAEELKTVLGNDGKFAFDIPLDRSSSDPRYRDLDKISFKTYLDQEGFTSPYLLWYLEYCCKDDYGQKLSAVSAWAGLHYFAARKGKAANAESNAVLTWPEGNGWLMQALSAACRQHIRPASMLYRLDETATGSLQALVYDLKTRHTYTIEAERVLLAAPQYVNHKLLAGRSGIDWKDFNYSPWLIANITLKASPASAAIGRCWDNVAYQTPSVGYVNAGQQNLETTEGRKVITYYLPLCDHAPQIARLAAYSRSYEQWLDMILPELEYMHPAITDEIEKADLWVWGHGMISPAPGFIWGQSRRNACAPLNDQIFFAHTDLSGVSIFEEAFHQGIRAAKELLASL